MKHLDDIDSVNLEIIEDKPRIIRLNSFLTEIQKSWKIGLILVLSLGFLFPIFGPSKDMTTYRAETTLYAPASISRKEGSHTFIISNNLSQLDNMVELIQSRIYREAISQELGTDNLYNIGNYMVSRIDETDMLSLVVTAHSSQDAQTMCEALLTVLIEQLGKTVGINNMVSVDSIKVYSVSTASSLLNSFLTGYIAGVVIWLLTIIIRNLRNNKFNSPEEVERTIKLPVMTVIPRLEDRK